jgi:hypothetical protein
MQFKDVFPSQIKFSTLNANRALGALVNSAISWIAQRATRRVRRCLE